MKKWIVLAAVCSLPITLMAQDDDMYFVPTKENVAKETENYGMPKNTYYSGSNRSVDDYNGRLSSHVTRIDSLGQEVETEDYQYTRQLSRFDDYTPSQAYWEGYRDGRWSSPWYYGRYGWYSTWYDPWYSSWYDPWYDSWYYGSYGYYGWSSPWRYGWYGGYYRPWGYYGYYGWHTPIYIGGRGHRTTAHDRFHANRNIKGSSSFGNGFGRASGGSNRGGFGNSRTTNNSRTSSSNGTFGTSRSSSTGFGSSNRSSSSSSSSFGSSRSSGSSSGGSRGGSFGGGSRSGGGGGRFGR